MPIFSFHLAQTSLATTAMALLFPPRADRVAGLRHAECMVVMTLGSPIFSRERLRLRQLAMFASWESEHAIDDFLKESKLGRTLNRGWHVRLQFLRRWGRVSEFDDLPPNTGDDQPGAPVVAVTLARLRLSEVPRFVRWGKPVEELVRDHPGQTLALGAIRPFRTVSTFSIWCSQRAMTDMVRGRDAGSGSAPGSSAGVIAGSAGGAARHAAAMTERTRRDFHHEFTTLRFRALAEYGSWQGRSEIVPRLGAGDSSTRSS